MTFMKTISMTFGNFFPLFHKYWDIVSKRGTEHTSLEVEILTSGLFCSQKSNGIKKKMGY